MSNPSDFVIENGVLTKYVGPGGDVAVPEGVTEIGENAFVDLFEAMGEDYLYNSKTNTVSSTHLWVTKTITIA